jgi:tetratricopeptide (TPR) repeat protein
VLDDRNSAPNFYRGRAEIAEKQWKAAIDDFSRVIEVAPEEAGAYYWRAMARANSGLYGAALKDVDRYLNVHGDDADGYLLQAQINVGLGRPADAKASATDALRHYRIDNDEAGAAKAQALLDALQSGSPTTSRPHVQGAI